MCGLRCLVSTILQADLSALRGEHTSIKVASERATKNLERAELQLEALKTTHAALEKKYAESEANVASLRQQVEKWAALDKRESSEMETLRKGRIALEVKVKQLEAEKEEAETEREKETARAEKLQRRVDKYKEAWEAHQVRSLSGVVMSVATEGSHRFLMC